MKKKSHKKDEDRKQKPKNTDEDTDDLLANFVESFMSPVPKSKSFDPLGGSKDKESDKDKDVSFSENGLPKVSCRDTNATARLLDVNSRSLSLNGFEPSFFIPSNLILMFSLRVRKFVAL